ncbi:unnamed protein product [Kluyveromyces dobzhanskii CBS 2104]|uniref:WGS project CCBQ000000000 data, contig 00102 n=1 Tax=Kluyveromyces dobzhanskii CBS 2104 TaxID=1427455 RepID=A0A0A8L6Z6_9SACH|nr:unnamed protein product [Kluyveromyces dobzhanskii CBS 2104]
MPISLGAIIYVALKPVFKIYFILGVGFMLAKYQIVGIEAARSISNMVVNAILPCLLFNKIVANIQAKDIKEIGTIVLTAILLFSIGGVLSLAVRVALPVPKQWLWGLMFAGLFPNISDLPIAYVQSMGTGLIFNSEDADKGVAYCCIFLTTQSFLMMNFGMFRLVGLDFRQPLDDTENSLSLSDTGQEENELRSKGVTDLNSSKDRNESESEGEAVLSSETKNLKNRNGGHSTDQNSTELTDLNSIPESDLASENNLEILKPQMFRKGTSYLSEERSTQQRTGSDMASSHSIENTNNYKHRTRSLSQTTASSNSTTSHMNRARYGKRTQTINDVISEYSVADKVRAGELDLRRPLTLTADIGEENAGLAADDRSSQTADNDEELNVPDNEDGNTLQLVRTATNKSLRKVNSWFQRHKLGWFQYGIINFFRPASLGAVLGIVCSMIPWVQALFVNTYVHVHHAPDKLPVLNFIMDATAYIGNACIPLGLLLLGGTIARLKIGSLPKGFLTVAIAVATIRLAVIPIIGVLWTNKIFDLGWIEEDIAKLVIILTFAMPSATAQVYFTAFFTPVDGPHIQMDCLSVLFLVQYTLLFITLPFVVSYTLKVDLKY